MTDIKWQEDLIGCVACSSTDVEEHHDTTGIVWEVCNACGHEHQGTEFQCKEQLCRRGAMIGSRYCPEHEDITDQRLAAGNLDGVFNE